MNQNVLDYSSSKSLAHLHLTLNAWKDLSEENKKTYLPIISQWIEKEWGYMRGFIGQASREEHMKNITDKYGDDFYVVTCNVPSTIENKKNRPVGIFFLDNQPNLLDTNQVVQELQFFYVDEGLRNFGLGGRILEMAKGVAKDIITLDTLKPHLDHFYGKHAAKVIAERTSLGCPSEYLMIPADKSKQQTHSR